jgi:hypothetical protein
VAENFVMPLQLFLTMYIIAAAYHIIAALSQLFGRNGGCAVKGPKIPRQVR